MAKKKKERPKKSGNTIKIPDYVRSRGKEAEQAYIEYVMIDEQLHEHPDRFRQIISGDPSNDEELEVLDMIQSPHYIKKRIGHLPKKEREEIWKDWGQLQKFKTQKGTLKKKWDPLTCKTRDYKNMFNERKTEMLELFGQWKSCEEVKKIVEEEWGYFVTIPKLREFSNANKERIKELREKWEADYADFDVAKKRGRIERLAYLIKTQLDKYQEKEHSVVHSREVRALLEQIRKEVEGDHITLDVVQKYDAGQIMMMNRTIDEITRKVNINSFIVSMVAAKKGLDPMKFMNRLQCSYYSRYTGYGKERAEEQEEINYPSKLVYNWTEIEQKHSKPEDKKGEYFDYEEVNHENDLRKKLTEYLQERKKL